MIIKPTLNPGPGLWTTWSVDHQVCTVQVQGSGIVLNRGVPMTRKRLPTTGPLVIVVVVVVVDEWSD